MAMPDEAEDFISLWDDSHAGNPVYPQEVDWDELESWAVGNSISFDQSRIKTGRVIMQLLVTFFSFQLISCPAVLLITILQL